MLVGNRIVRLTLEAAERHGVSRVELLEELGPYRAALLERNELLEWGLVVSVFEALSRLVGGDVGTLRAIGRDMARSSSPDVIHDVTRSLSSPRAIFQFLDRWLPPTYPHLRLYIRFVTRRRLQLHGEIPEPHAPCEAFFQVLAARLQSLPELLGLPACVLVEERITPRTADLVLDLPEDPSLRARAIRRARALLARPSARRSLEEHRETLSLSLDALQKARDELRVALDRLPDLVLVHVGGRTLWTNRIFLQTLGYASLDEVVGRSIFDFVPPHARALVRESMARDPDPTAPPTLAEFGLVGKSGAELVVEVAPPQGVVFDGMPARLVVGRDVTERVRMQNKLIVADRLASIGLLAAGVAHEVNNPLGYVLNNIEIARKHLARSGDDTAVAREALGVALEGVDRIKVIVRELLLLSRGDDGAFHPTDIGHVVESTLALARPQLESTAELVVSVAPTPQVKANAPRVAQILLNLVANAVEAMRGRPREQNVLRVTTRSSDGGHVALEVADTGVGIAAGDLARVFEPFFTTKEAGRGTGLGLAIAHRLVVETGGEISVTSEENRGATFCVLFPIATAESDSG